MSLVSDLSVREPFWAKCKILAYSLSGQLLIHLWPHLPHALVVSSHPPNTTIPALWPLSYRGVIYITVCASPPGITSIVFLFHPSLSWLLCSSLEWHRSCLGFPSPKKIPGRSTSLSPPLQVLYPRLSPMDYLRDRNLEWSVSPRIEQKISDGQLWGAIVGSVVPRLDRGGGDLLTLVAAYELLWSRNVSEVHSSISLCYTEPSRFRWNLLKNIQGNISDRDGHFNCAAPPQGH